MYVCLNVCDIYFVTVYIADFYMAVFSVLFFFPSFWCICLALVIFPCSASIYFFCSCSINLLLLSFCLCACIDLVSASYDMFALLFITFSSSAFYFVVALWSCNVMFLYLFFFIDFSLSLLMFFICLSDISSSLVFNLPCCICTVNLQYYVPFFLCLSYLLSVNSSYCLFFHFPYCCFVDVCGKVVPVIANLFPVRPLPMFRQPSSLTLSL